MRIEKNVNHVSNEMASVEYNVDALNQRIHEIEMRYNSYLDELINMNITNEEKILNLTNYISELEKEILVLQEENDIQQDVGDTIQNNIQIIQQQNEEFKSRITELENNTLHFSYDYETQTLNVFGKPREEIKE